ncbi:MerR family transcriptional regulator [Methylocapsa aurea]|uniref:MerR family transcriptional regulator n=1 Tax=Methylocapsa aurea TaxID=663610 RepID=UPI00055DBD2B|nr:MerR family transcriptional regulator [Methylocapsa aurea]
MPDELSIGQLAAAAGVNVETIRYYQRRGLLHEPAKPFGGQRRYPAAVAKRVRFIRRAQALGFTLEEIFTLLRLDGAICCAETRKLAASKLGLIETKLTNLQKMRDALAELTRQCDAGRTDEPCPIINVLARDD